MFEYAFAIHLSVSEVTFIFMAICPTELSLSIHNIFFELPLVSASVSKDCKSIALAHISVPNALVLCQDSIRIP